MGKAVEDIQTSTQEGIALEHVAKGGEKKLARMELQSTSADIWDKKYRLKDKAGKAVDFKIEDTVARVASALSEVEQTEELREHWFERFAWALDNGALPAGRIISNAGAQAYKPATSTINCTVSGTVSDSMNDILNKNHEAGMTLKAGCGIGYEFSTLRPKGAYVSGAGAYTSGPLSFMDIFDKMCFTVSSAGGRRGAQMATFDVSHPLSLSKRLKMTQTGSCHSQSRKKKPKKTALMSLPQLISFGVAFHQMKAISVTSKA